MCIGYICLERNDHDIKGPLAPNVVRTARVYLLRGARAICCAAEQSARAL